MEAINKERRFILNTILILTLFGILMIYEASSLYAYKAYGDFAYFFKKQVIFFLVGLALFFLALLVNLGFLKKHSKEFLILVVFLLIGILFLGRKAGGARRWLNLPGFNLQPSEMLKIFFLIYCADYISRKGSIMKNFRKLLPLGLALGTICFFVVLQPDLGTAIFWMIWILIFFFMHRARKKYIFLIVLLGIVSSFFLVAFYPYRFRRITAYLNPFADPQDAGFQLIQSQIAYGEGGILGVGLGEGRQKLFFLPAAHTDFIFSIIAEEFGLIGSLSIIFIFFIIFHKMFNIAKLAKDDFRRSILLGIILVFFLEVVINIGVSCGFFPTKGLPLPFISYGGSNLITHYILLGLFFNASREEEISNKRCSLVS
jgi:cell division protein FtsW